MNEHGSEHGKLVITVHDEDAGGEPLRFEAGPGEKVGKIIDELYKELNLTAQPSDRLLCLGTGQPVAPHRDEHVRDYAKTACSELVWTFARDTGGA